MEIYKLYVLTLSNSADPDDMSPSFSGIDLVWILNAFYVPFIPVGHYVFMVQQLDLLISKEARKS